MHQHKLRNSVRQGQWSLSPRTLGLPTHPPVLPALRTYSPPQTTVDRFLWPLSGREVLFGTILNPVACSMGNFFRYITLGTTFELVLVNRSPAPRRIGLSRFRVSEHPPVCFILATSRGDTPASHLCGCHEASWWYLPTAMQNTELNAL